MVTSLFDWLCVWCGMFFLSFLWLSYLIRIVLNDEVVQERRRRRMRESELERRAIEDKAKRHKRTAGAAAA